MALTPQAGYNEEALNIDNYAKVSMIRKEYDAFSYLLKKLREVRQDSAEASYYIACIYARQRKTEKSVARLKKAVEEGYGNQDLLKHDSHLENIRSTSYYKELILYLNDKHL